MIFDTKRVTFPLDHCKICLRAGIQDLRLLKIRFALSKTFNVQCQQCEIEEKEEALQASASGQGP